MDFAISSHLTPILERVRHFIDTELIPLEPTFLNGEFREMVPALAGKRAQVKAAGLWAPFLPAEQGGMGLTLAEYAHVSEELGRSPLGPYVFNCQAPDVGNMEILMHYGTPAQKAPISGATGPRGNPQLLCHDRAGKPPVPTQQSWTRRR